MQGSLIRRNGAASILGGILFAVLFSSLTIVEAGRLALLDFLETHWILHILQAPVYALLAIGVLQLRRRAGSGLGRIARFGSILALLGFTVGTIAGAIVPFVELGLGQDTEEGVLEAVVHIPEFMPYVFGTLLLGIGIALSGALSRDRGVLLAVAALGMFGIGAAGDSIIRIVPAALFGLSWIWVGVALLETRRTPATAVAYAS